MKYLTTLLLVAFSFFSNAQSFIEYHYDNAGNRTERVLVSSEPNRDNDENINTDYDSDDEAKGEPEVSSVKKILTSSLNGVSIYPNPTVSSIEINLGDSYDSDLSQSFDILDLNGKIVQRFEIISQTSTLQMSGYRSGMYYVHFKNDGILKESWKVVKIN
jgi:hypothetical protein